jgi:hypothetical protein
VTSAREAHAEWKNTLKERKRDAKAQLKTRTATMDEKGKT